MEREGPDGLLTVGLVARRSGLTAKARRHYDRVGLLRPTVVDRTTGYRLYRSEQIAEAWLGCVLSILAVASGRRRDGSQGGGGAHSGAIRDDGNAARRPSGGRAADPRSAGHALVHLLRSLDLPLDQVRTAVAGWKGGDTEAVSDVIREHRRHLDARVVRLRGALHRIDHLLVEGLEAAMPEADDSTAAVSTKSPPGTGSVSDVKLLAAQLFNDAWRLMEQEERTRDDDDRMIHTAHAARYHWGQVPTATPAHLARAEWQVARVYSVLGRPEPALHHATRVLDICQENAIGDWDLAFAYEALARAHAAAGDADRARDYTDRALAAAEDIADGEDRDLVLADLETIPGQPRYW